MTRNNVKRARTAGVYCRISKDPRGRELGVDRQEALCRQLAAEQGLTITAVYVDNNLSGFRKGRRRPQYEAMLAALAANEFDVLLTYHPDRLTRQNLQAEQLIQALDESGIAVETVRAGKYDLSTSAGRYRARSDAAVAQERSEHASELIKDANDQAVARRLPAATAPPYGYRRVPVDPKAAARGEKVERTLEINEVEAAVVRDVADKLTEGWSLLAITRDLNERHVPTRGRRIKDAEGKVQILHQPWVHSTVKMITKPVVANLRVHRGEIVGEGTWEPIIERRQWERLVARLDDPSRRIKGRSTYLLSGLVFSVHGDVMTGRPERGRRTYSTRKERTGPGLSIEATKLDEFVTELVLYRLAEHSIDLTDDRGAAEEAAVAAIQAEIDALKDMRREHKIGFDEWRELRESLEVDLKAARASVPRRQQPRSKLLGSVNVREAFAAATVTERSLAIAAVVECIEVGPATRGRYTPMADRVTIRWRA